jgi:hypothetical protein
MQYDVMIEGRTGERYLDSTGWKYKYSIITWCREQTWEAAWETVARLKGGKSRDVKRIWVEERPTA